VETRANLEEERGDDQEESGNADAQRRGGVLLEDALGANVLGAVHDANEIGGGAGADDAWAAVDAWRADWRVARAKAAGRAFEIGRLAADAVLARARHGAWLAHVRIDRVGHAHAAVALQPAVAALRADLARAALLLVRANVRRALAVGADKVLVARAIGAARARHGADVQIAAADLWRRDARRQRAGGWRLDGGGRRRCRRHGGGAVALAQTTTVVLGRALGGAGRRRVADLLRVARSLIGVVAEAVLGRRGADVVARQEVGRLADDERRDLRLDGGRRRERGGAGGVARAAKRGAHLVARLAELAEERVLLGRRAAGRRQLEVVRVPEVAAIGAALLDQAQQRDLAGLRRRHLEAPRRQVRLHFGRRVHNRLRARLVENVDAIDKVPLAHFRAALVLRVQQQTTILALKLFHTNRNLQVLAWSVRLLVVM
jgi:hypothetical protein